MAVAQRCYNFVLCAFDLLVVATLWKCLVVVEACSWLTRELTSLTNWVGCLVETNPCHRTTPKFFVIQLGECWKLSGM